MRMLQPVTGWVSRGLDELHKDRSIVKLILFNYYMGVITHHLNAVVTAAAGTYKYVLD